MASLRPYARSHEDRGRDAGALVCEEGGVLSFDRGWVLVLLLLPAGWAAWEWTRSSRRLALVLKALALAAVIAALAEPRLSVPETRAGVAVLVDTSASMTATDLARASAFVSSVEQRRGRSWTRVIPFARAVRLAADAELRREWQFRRTAGEAGRGTDIEAAVREAIASFPPDTIPRVVLISDGQENRGSFARAAWLAKQLRVPIDTLGMAGTPLPTLRLEQVSFPRLAFTGERFPIDLTVQSPRRATGSVELKAEGKTIGISPVAIEPGSNQLRVHANLNVSGAVEISATVRAGDLGEVHYEQAVTLRRPRVLYVSQDPAGTEAHFLDTLRAGQFDINQLPDLTGRSFDEYQIVVLNNTDLERIPPASKDALEQYVREGGAVLVIGGERNVYPEGKKIEDALDRTLPAKIAPPRSPEGTCVVLIMDKSSSMEGRKMELARLSAIGVIENLRAIDLVGVLIFDNSFQWAVPIRKAEDRTTIKRIVGGIMPDGGTQIAPALAEAHRRIAPVQATYKHIVLLTDGISEEGDSMNVSREAGRQKITISTVGLGQDVNRAYLEKVAANANGKSYFLVDPSGLEQILLKDVMEHTGSTAVEKPVHPVVAKKTDVLDGVEIASAPPLRGYVRFTARPGAETVLMFEKDPLYVSWQYGLGHAAVWTSDAKSRWAEKWVDWPGFDRFWLNVFRNLLPHAQSADALARYDDASGKLTVEYRLAPNTPAPEKVPEIFAMGPEGFRRAVPVRKVAEGLYAGEVPIDNRQGLFRIRPVEETRAFPETGLYRQEEELSTYGNNIALLRHVAGFTGGRFNPRPGDVFDTGGRSVPSTLRLWPGLLALAVLLNLTELIMRKWSTVADVLGLRK
ncbi:MAG TPA: VWA domain-containing protein [Bryobacteraceae bacterium]|nr:VWA domain-containing protein [Bryobacteraceae bacterium]